MPPLVFARSPGYVAQDTPEPMNMPATNPPDDHTEVITYPYSPKGKKPKFICVPKGDDMVASSVRGATAWDFYLATQLYVRFGRGGSFVEVGANIGSDTVVASDFFKTCYAFEPLPKHVASIRKTLALNQITNVQLFAVAVSDRCGMNRIYAGPPGNTGAASLKQNHSGMDQFEEVPISTLDSIPQTITDVTYLHIDTEGHDIKVLQGAREFIARQSQRPMIKMEFQPRTLTLHGSSVTELIQFLDEFQYISLFMAAGTLAPLTYATLTDMFFMWRKFEAWIDLYLAPHGLVY
jgi:FkbM family methyltransferase